MSTEKRSVSAPLEEWARADKRCDELGYKTFSEYIQALIRADVIDGGSHVREVFNSSKVDGVAADAARAAVAVASEKLPQAPVRPVKYPSLRRSKRRRPTEQSSKPGVP